MKSFPLLLCALLLVCSANLFAQDAQRPRIRPRVYAVDAGADAPIGIQGTDTGQGTTRPLRGSLFGFSNEHAFRAIIRSVGALDDETTNRALETRLNLSASSDR